MVQWLGACTFTAEVPGSNPGQATRILQCRARPKTEGRGIKKRDISPQKIKRITNNHTEKMLNFTYLLAKCKPKP